LSQVRKKSQIGSRTLTAVDISKTAVLGLDGQKHRLVYNFNEIALAEPVAGCNLLRALENLRDLSGIQLRGLLYAAIKPLNAEATIDEVGAMIRVDTIEPITTALAEAYALSVPEKTL
jgi:hypothetical protein